MTDAQVQAAGGLVVRADGRIAVIHRPRYDDWSLPKGKLEPDESFETGALREVEEETGIRGRIVEELAPTRYLDRKGRDKIVRFLRDDLEPFPDLERPRQRNSADFLRLRSEILDMLHLAGQATDTEEAAAR